MWNIRVEQLEKIYYKFPLRPGDTCLVSWLSPGVAENLDSLPELLWQNINTTVEPAAATTAIPPRPQRKMSVDLETLETLEKRLTQRPEKQELMERNILKDDKVAPSLQAARDQLKKSQLQDKLDQALLQRPKREELVEGGILKDETPVLA
ncbi:hypothetical protein PHLCEN_2v345 [Hermanssonia centrifuga]|uniref:Uncharacterized protein n=1 Tax=Hermanssonia centrifuga TaxID=98765 RepID=A0A2R6S6G3_9APHY|nr:hypothetical protein PHLCEN_2v345 [Hermanssonia centrifuga]